MSICFKSIWERLCLEDPDCSTNDIDDIDNIDDINIYNNIDRIVPLSNPADSDLDVDVEKFYEFSHGREYNETQLSKRLNLMFNPRRGTNLRASMFARSAHLQRHVGFLIGRGGLSYSLAPPRPIPLEEEACLPALPSIYRCHDTFPRKPIDGHTVDKSDSDIHDYHDDITDFRLHELQCGALYAGKQVNIDEDDWGDYRDPSISNMRLEMSVFSLDTNFEARYKPRLYTNRQYYSPPPWAPTLRRFSKPRNLGLRHTKDDAEDNHTEIYPDYFANEERSIAQNMDELRALTEKTRQDTAKMKVITMITAIFLPTTFSATILDSTLPNCGVTRRPKPKPAQPEPISRLGHSGGCADPCCFIGGHSYLLKMLLFGLQTLSAGSFILSILEGNSCMNSVMNSGKKQLRNSACGTIIGDPEGPHSVSPQG